MAHTSYIQTQENTDRHKSIQTPKKEKTIKEIITKLNLDHMTLHTTKKLLYVHPG